MRPFRLEFNEKQQNFHHNYGQHEPESWGWFTIAENCTDLEFRIFESFANRKPIEKLTKEYLLECYNEVQGFLKNLAEYNITIVQQGRTTCHTDAEMEATN